MEEKIVTVKVKDVAHSPLKLRLVANLLRGKVASEALEILTLVPKKGALIMRKAVLSGIANGRDRYGVDKDALVISKVSIDEARILKRTKFESRGRVSIIDKRRSHINLELKVK